MYRWLSGREPGWVAEESVANVCMCAVGVRMMSRERCNCRIVWCSNPDNPAALLLADHYRSISMRHLTKYIQGDIPHTCSISSPSQALLRHLESVGVVGGQLSSIRGDFMRRCTVAVGVHEFNCVCAKATTSFVLR